MWVSLWFGNLNQRFQNQIETGQFLRTLPADSKIICDESTIEILSKLDMKRFERYWIADTNTINIINKEATADSPVYVTSWERKFKPLPKFGDVVFRADSNVNHDEAIVVIKVTR